VETGDFKRFAKGNTYAAFLGLTPGEHSSSDRRTCFGFSNSFRNHNFLHSLPSLLKTYFIQCYQAT
ncbi:MAG: hypothetical protein DBX58_01610, partial [Clostridiales bacterium]